MFEGKKLCSQAYRMIPKRGTPITMKVISRLEKNILYQKSIR
jgi:hypothetical protein